ncbi:MAG: sigma-54-dependent Fis family transcriptional regulator, partial [Gelidibacter sp.]|nr:sigma-54-dependent Fis family transcriptional regulator [Gelidibacter sp.]
LFGHEKGSFTGAAVQRIGRFEEADGGTLFIDEVGDIPLQAQVKLLRAIQFNEIQRLGGNTTIKVDVRIITATHRNLEEMIKENEFREDLFYRLNVVSICLPTLKQRKSDIPILIDHFIKKHAAINNKDVKSVTSEALDVLMKYTYPGNIRELENCIQRAVIMCDKQIDVKDLPQHLKYQIEFPENQELISLKEAERQHILKVLQATNNNKTKAAEILQIDRKTLRDKIK